MIDRVLIIDDSLPVHRLIQSHLSEMSVECISAYDGEHGISVAEAQNPGLILLDVDLPNADGFEICARLRANTRTSRIPIIFLTADFNTADKIRGLQMGAVDYITKPCNYAELSARVMAAMRSRRSSDQRSMRDSLTGLWSKAYLDQHLTGRISLARQAGIPLACIAVDIDDLARINREQGRSVGDDVICCVGNTLTDRCTVTDVVCSLGAGRFALLVGMDRHVAARRAMRHAADLERELAARREFDFPVSCGYGVADIDVAQSNTVVERAISSMRRAKLNGQASVSIARPHRNAA